MVFTPEAGRHRYKRGENNPRIVEIKEGVEVKIGDMLVRDTAGKRYAVPISDVTWNTNLSTTQAAAVVEFLGVSAQHIKADATRRQCRVNTTGIHEMDLPAGAAALNPGDPVGPGDSGASGLLDQTVAAVAAVANAVGRVYEYTPANSSKVQVDIRGRVFHGPVA